MNNCSICNKALVKGKYQILVRNSGKLVYFCQSSCRKWFNLAPKKCVKRKTNN